MTCQYDTSNINGSEVEVNAESTLERPADPTREGYDFGGWYADEACTTAYNFNAPIGASGVANTGENQVSSTAPIGIAVLLIAGAATMIFVVRKNEENS